MPGLQGGRFRAGRSREVKGMDAPHGNSDAASEIQPKPKRGRGRPRAWSDAARAGMRAFFPEIKSERGLNDLCYRNLAVGLLLDDPRFAWVCDGPAMTRGEPHAWRPGILVELGRLLDAETIRAGALRVCEVKPRTTREAVAMIRRFRLRREAKGDLGRDLRRVVNAFATTHPSVPWSEVLAVLVDLVRDVEATVEVHREA